MLTASMSWLTGLVKHNPFLARSGNGFATKSAFRSPHPLHFTFPSNSSSLNRTLTT